ncbi:hypothetical protein HY990_04130 [Candidatus Micrarchaeota archaeon]|nr:hypothetical protein [Candidatus Micrarchaeota archaeon]
MQKDTLVKILAVLIVLGFITELAGIFGSNSAIFSNLFNSVSSSASNRTGIAQFNGTIRTYNGALFLPSNVTLAVPLSELKTIDGVRSVVSSNGYYILYLESRDDVFTTAQILRQKGLSPTAIANVAVPSVLTVTFSDYTAKNVTFNGNFVPVEVEPYFEPDSAVPVAAAFEVIGDQVSGFINSRLSAPIVNVVIPGTIINSSVLSTTYQIPWENRTYFPKNTTGYREVDSILISPPMSPDQILQKRSLPYVVYIDSSSVLVSPTTSTSVLASDFSNLTLSFPNSTLTLDGSSSLSVPFDKKTLYSYQVLLPDSFDSKHLTGFRSVSGTGSTLSDLNSTLNITLRCVSAGDTLVVLGPAN